MDIRKYKRTLFVSGGAVGLIAAAVLFGLRLNGAYSSAPPQEYASAYRSIVAHGKRVTAMTADVQRIIADVNRLDASNETAAALADIERARAKNQGAKQEALALTLELQTLVGELNQSASFVEKQVLFGTIDLEINLVREFVGYTQEVESFLATLKQALSSGSYEDRKAVYEEMAAVNARIDAINRLNAEFSKRVSSPEGE